MTDRPRFPSPLVTERLIIRTPELGDAQMLNEAIRETWDGLYRWMPWAITPPTLEESVDTCRRMSSHTAEGDDYVLFCFERATGRFVMASGCHPKSWEVPAFEIGYWCRTSEQGKGFVTEAVLAITQAAFEVMGARRIEIRCDTDNTASRAVAERAGYKLNAEFACHRRNKLGELGGTYVFAQTRPDPA